MSIHRLKTGAPQTRSNVSTARGVLRGEVLFI
jgi:hypothetical protein